MSEAKMVSLDVSRYRELEILKQVAASPRLSNRLAARRLGVSVRLAHETLKRMVTKGWLHVTKHHSRRWDYFLTPRGMAEKARLTLEFLDLTMEFYREARRASARVCRELRESGIRRVSLLGANELAEIVYLGLCEWDLELVAVYGVERPCGSFLGLPVLPAGSASAASGAEALIVCLYDPEQPMRACYLPPSVPGLPGMVWVFGEPMVHGVGGQDE